MLADYQLRHQLYGQQGSLWEKQASETTRAQLRRIVKEAGNASTLTEIDQIAAGVTGADSVLVEDLFFTFMDGNFAVRGRAQRDYEFREGMIGDSRLHLAYRGESATVPSTSVPTQLARISADFDKAAQGDASANDRDWYLIPIPKGVTPLVIEGKAKDTYLVNGIDFLARDGYVAMTDDPAVTLPTGLVRIHSATLQVVAPDAGAGTHAGGRYVGRYLTEYAGKTQSIGAFKRAAAEFAGMFVTQDADIVVDVRDIAPGVRVYTLAAAGPVEIRYPHVPLVKHQRLEPGFIVSGRFDVVTSRRGAPDNLKQMTAASWGRDIMLDGILPVQGLTWDGRSRIPIDYALTGEGGTPHLRLHFSGPQSALERFWEFQRLHELKTGNYLHAALGEPTTPATVDFWELLEGFYGPQLGLVLLADHTPRINTRLWRFALEHRPQSCVALIGIDLNVNTEQMVTNTQGIPLLDEDGEDYYYPGDPLAGYDNYFRPGGVGLYLRPAGSGYYLRP